MRITLNHRLNKHIDVKLAAFYVTRFTAHAQLFNKQHPNFLHRINKEKPNF